MYDIAICDDDCLTFAFMLLGNILIFRALNRYSDELHRNTEQKLIISRQNMDLQYYSQMQMLDSKYQVFIHNISHHLKTIGELAKEKKIDNIISIIKDLNIELENNALTIYCDNSVVNSILSEKKSKIILQESFLRLIPNMNRQSRIKGFMGLE